MKQIFDALRALFAHKPRDFPASHALLTSLSYLERRLRGFSNRLDILCGAKPLAAADQVLQRNLREALQDTLQFLCQNLNRFEEAGRAGVGGAAYAVPADLQSLLTLKDTSGYLRTTAFAALRGVSEWQRHDGRYPYKLQIRPESLDLDKGALVIRYCIHATVDTGAFGHDYLTKAHRLENVDLDSLLGAASALQRMRKHLLQQLAEAPNLPEIAAALKAHQLQEQDCAERDARIRENLNRLSPADRDYLRRLVAGSYNPRLANLFK